MGVILVVIQVAAFDLCADVGTMDITSITCGPIDEFVMEIPNSNLNCDVVCMCIMEIMVDQLK